MSAGNKSIISLDDYEREAEKIIKKDHWQYIAGGVTDNITLRANRLSFHRFVIIPRVLRNVANRSMQCRILGTNSSMPILIAPTASNQLAHVDGEVAVAKAALKADTIQTLSTFASKSIEDVSAVGGKLWFQLYVFRDRAITRSLVERAEQAGARALVVTVDLPELGLRENLDRVRFKTPPHVKLANLERYLDGKSADLVGGLAENVDASLTWDDIEWLMSITTMPLVLKGIMSPQDAEIAARMGVAGIVVSNHGARQLDLSSPTILALEHVVKAVRGRIPVFVDGGIRRGTHVFIALALGASAVFIGRPLIMGIAVDGERGATAVLERIREEFDNTLAQAGCKTPAAISRSMIRQIPSPLL